MYPDKRREKKEERREKRDYRAKALSSLFYQHLAIFQSAFLGCASRTNTQPYNIKGFYTISSDLQAIFYTTVNSPFFISFGVQSAPYRFIFLFSFIFPPRILWGESLEIHPNS